MIMGCLRESSKRNRDSAFPIASTGQLGFTEQSSPCQATLVPAVNGVSGILK